MEKQSVDLTHYPLVRVHCALHVAEAQAQEQRRRAAPNQAGFQSVVKLDDQQHPAAVDL